jgi:hypothetical protein
MRNARWRLALYFLCGTLFLAIAFDGAAMAQVTSGAAITSGDIVVYQTYSGSTSSTISSAASQVYLDEFSPTGTPVQQITANAQVPSGSTPGTQYALTDSGSGSTDGEISLSPNGEYIAVPGYNAAITTSGVVNTTSASVSRTIGVFNTQTGGTIDTSTSLNNAFSGNNFRGVATADGSNFYGVGTDASGSASNGVIYATLGSTSGTQLTTDKTYSINVYNNQLYIVDDGQPTNGIYALPNQSGALPTSSFSPSTETSVAFANKENGIGTSTGPEGFSLLQLNNNNSGSPDTVYMADNVDGLIEKFTRTGTTGSDGNGASAEGFSLTGTIALAGVTGLTATETAQGVQIYATVPYQNSTAFGGIYSFLDTSGYDLAPTGTLNEIVAGTKYESFKGVVVYPDVVPEPSSASLIMLGLMGLLAKRRRPALTTGRFRGSCASSK